MKATEWARKRVKMALGLTAEEEEAVERKNYECQTLV